MKNTGFKLSYKIKNPISTGHTYFTIVPASEKKDLTATEVIQNRGI